MTKRGEREASSAELAALQAENEDLRVQLEDAGAHGARLAAELRQLERDVAQLRLAQDSMGRSIEEMLALRARASAAETELRLLYPRLQHAEGQLADSRRALGDSRFELSRQRQQLEAMIANAPDGVLTLDEDGRVLTANGAAERIFGMAAEGLVGCRLDSLLRSPGSETWRCQLAAFGPASVVRSPGFVLEVDVAGLSHPDVRVEIAVSEWYLGETRRLLAFVRDIGERRQLALQLAQSARLVQLGEMAASLAHEVTQPIQAVQIYADLLRMRLDVTGPDGAELDRLLSRIAEQIERATSVIGHVRMFARRDAGSLEWFDPLQTIRKTLDLCGRQMREAGIAVELSGAEGWCVHGHPVRIEQVLLNLLSNARDALLARRGQLLDRPVVEVSLAGDDAGQVKIRVRDNGGGIPSNILSRIFDPFFTTKEGRSTGLGLSISRGLIQEMQGTIQARNTGPGAEFEITLPARRQQQEAPRPPRGRKPKLKVVA